MVKLGRLRQVREEKALSQRDLAAISGVAHPTIGQLERGERQARPSTLRKLASALGVEPAALLSAQAETVSSTDQSSSTGDKTLANRGRDQAPRKRIPEASEWLKLAEQRRKVIEQRSKESKEWEAAGKWAEYFVSGEATKTDAYQDDALSTTLKRLTRDEEGEEQLAMEDSYLFNTLQLPRGTDAEERNILWSKLDSDDLRETVEVAQRTLSLVKSVLNTVTEKQLSIELLPELYYRHPAFQRRIEKLQLALNRYAEEATEVVQELLEIYAEATRTVDAAVAEIKREGGKLTEIARQAQIAVVESQKEGGRES